MHASNDWQPSASIADLQYRAKILSAIRNFFTARNYLEVETPYMGRYGVTDIYLQSIPAYCHGQTFYLQTSPEYHMKRLLAAGSGPIFQLARVFRDDEFGRWHNPEFTLLEWYQLDVDHLYLLTEVDTLLQQILGCPPLMQLSYRQAFLMACDIDLWQTNLTQLQEVLVNFNLGQVLAVDEQDIDQYLFLLMSHVVEPFFKTYTMPVAITDFPATQAALAQTHNGIAARFEVYFQGVELANGFHELTDAHLQRERFVHDQLVRKARNLPSMAVDERFLAAMQAGMPNCSGVALGVDRLLALSQRHTAITNSISFDLSRA